MAITTTQITGQDGVSPSRQIINDNFNIVTDEINALETFLDPDAATLNGMNSIEALELNIGPAGSFNLEITASEFNINTSVELTSPSALLTLKGLMNHDSFSLLDEIAQPTPVIDPTSGFANYTIKQTSGSDYIIQLDIANPGQEVSFFLEQYSGTGDVTIQAASGAVFVLDSTNTKIILDDVGSSVTLRYVIDSANNGAYYIVGSHNVTLSS